jgi:CelD/BcsL family acetyltransferase involved in cellulose biosynthesis
VASSTPTTAETDSASASDIHCSPLDFDRITRAEWDRLYATTLAATPFSRWTFHRAWWDAYGATAHEQYLVCRGAGDGPMTAVMPLMHRHEQEPQDERTATVLRRRQHTGTSVRPDAKAIFFGASYHADYATLLCTPADLSAATHAVVDALAGPPDSTHGDQPWDVVDLRRLRTIDPALPALESALRSRALDADWEVIREREDVCPVVTVPPDADWDGYLGTLSKKARHEIRRKLRRAQAGGELSISIERPTREAIETFIELHQRRFGAEGLFPSTEGGERSRQFVHRLAELELSEPDCPLHVALVRSGDRLIFSALAFDDGETCYLYNAGMDPDAAELSPGVSGTAEYIRNRLEAGRRRFDFMRGDEPYKYEWGARDEVIERLIALRRDAA